MRRQRPIEYELEEDETAWREAKAILKSDPRAGIEKMRLLAENGSPLAIYEMGRASVNGIGTSRNLEEAEKWLRKLAEKKSVRGNYHLARLLLSQKRFHEAMEALRFSAARGFAPALLSLGKIYYFGWGVDRDVDRAVRYLEQASEGGSVFATRLLASVMLRTRTGLLARYRATELICKSAVQFILVLMKEGVESERLLR